MQTSKQNILHSGNNAINLEIVVLIVCLFFKFVLLLAIYHLIFAKSDKCQSISSGQQNQPTIRRDFHVNLTCTGTGEEPQTKGICV